MTKRTHEESDIVKEPGALGSDGSKHAKLDDKPTTEVEGCLEDLGSDSEGLDFVEDLTSDSDDDDSNKSLADEDKTVQDSEKASEKSGAIDENSWLVVHPPEPAIDMQSKFTVSNTGFCNVPHSKNPMDFFSLFLSEEMFLKMVQNTNENARHISENEPKTSNKEMWYDVTLDEMKKFWGVLINMGLSQRSSYKDFWSTHPVLAFPFFARIMTLQRFESILSMFRLTSQSFNSSSNIDPLEEVHSLLTSLNSAFKRFFVPDQEMRLDESLIFTSKLNSFDIKYVNKKYLVQGGIQQFEFCDPSSEFIIHIGLRKCRSGIKVNPDQSKDVIFDLLNEANLTGKGYHLFVRKAFMSLGLSQQLLLANTFVTGPLDLSQYRDFPSTITRHQLKPETTLYARSGDHLLIKYNNQKPVCLTTGGWAENQSTENAKCQQRVRPLLIRRYLRYISGKDKSYLHVTCTIDIDSCWKKIAFKLVDLALLNSFILFKSQKGIRSKYCRQTFLENIVQQLSSLGVGPSNSLGFGPNFTRGPSSVNLPQKPSSVKLPRKSSAAVNLPKKPSTTVKQPKKTSKSVKLPKKPESVKMPKKSTACTNLPKKSAAVNKLDLGGGHKLTKVKVSTIQICRVCRKEGKAVTFICPVCNVYVHRKCFGDLEHCFNVQKPVLNTVQHSPTASVPIQHVGSCVNVNTSGIFEVTVVKVESDSDD